eukprot:IDg4732t1
MVQSSTEKRARTRLRSAIAAVRQGMTYREAAARFHLPRSTLADSVAREACDADGERITKKLGRPTALKAAEEATIVHLLNGYADRGVPLTRTLLIEAVSLLVSRFSEERRAALPFKSGRPGLDFIRAFEKRHSHEIRFG